MEREFETKKKRILQELLKHRYAHRGFHRKPAVPENSMDAFKRAVLNGFGIELDIHLTKDGKLAVIHDASLKRTCGADLNIEEITLEEAQKYFLEESQEVIPDFDHVLKLIDGYVPLVVELKSREATRRNYAKELYVLSTDTMDCIAWNHSTRGR